MAATTINLPLYRVLTDLNVPEERAREAAEASVPDLSGLATKADQAAMEARMDARFSAFEDRVGRMIAERTDAQTKWIAAIAASTIIILLIPDAFCINANVRRSGLALNGWVCLHRGGGGHDGCDHADGAHGGGVAATCGRLGGRLRCAPAVGAGVGPGRLQACGSGAGGRDGRANLV